MVRRSAIILASTQRGYSAVAISLLFLTQASLALPLDRMRRSASSESAPARTTVISSQFVEQLNVLRDALMDRAVSQINPSASLDDDSEVEGLDSQPELASAMRQLRSETKLIRLIDGLLEYFQQPRDIQETNPRLLPLLSNSNKLMPSDVNNANRSDDGLDSPQPLTQSINVLQNMLKRQHTRRHSRKEAARRLEKLRKQMDLAGR